MNTFIQARSRSALIRTLFVLGALSACSANAGDSTSTQEVNGSWLGVIKVDSPLSVVLRTEEGALAGRLCTGSRLSDCDELDTVSLTGDHLRFARSFVENGRIETVTADLVVQGSAMIGTLHSTKCGCSFDLMLQRQPTS